jgi:peptidoglycan/xylan/chitin deacetylase (PgdA/CDA1 family)
LPATAYDTDGREGRRTHRVAGDEVVAMAGTAGLQVLKATAAVADVVRRPAPGVVVLIYHRVGATTPVQVDLPAALFAAQMDAVAGRVVPLDEALDAVARPEPPADDPIVVTFDDGTADFADVALPILADRSVPVTLYVATDFVERGIEFPDAGRPLSWAALADAHSTGLVTVGSHTHRHALLDRLGPDEVADELDRSVELIGGRLGVAADHFAYPKAVLGSGPAQAAVRSRFRSAAVGGNRANRYGATDPWRLSRTAVQVADGMRWFARKVEGGMAFEDVVRRAVNRRRYAGAQR